MASEWEIRGRSHVCTATGHEFADGEYFYTLLFLERGNFRREDLCEDAWQARDKKKSPYSFWRTKFEVPPPPAPEPLGKQSAETLLRKYMSEPGEEHANVRFILALMLERKRLLKPIEVKEEDGKRAHIYLHAKTGEVFIIPDPGLHLDQIEAVQMEVAGLLG
ncbi:MAG: hypothetical protein WCI40_07580 [Verrucomicrobiota bacterium]